MTLSAAVVTTSPAALRLEWDYVNFYGSPTVRTIYRRAKGDTPWGTPLATLTAAENTLIYSDTTVSAGVAYEYKLETLLNGSTTPTSTGYVSGGINLPAPDSRGKLLLLVDNSHAAALAPELTQLQQDLAGDGWTVLRTDLARSVVEPATAYTAQVGTDRLAEVSAVKNVIITAYNADPTNVKAVYIVGHLATPYSGYTGPDGHSDHYGAWPADTYYADINGTWTDTSINTISAADPRNRNVPGDGKFDQSNIASNLELQVGRVDFKNMTMFPSTAVNETELLRRYLRKAHDYRKKQGSYAAIERRAIVINAFSPGTGSPSMTTSIGGLLGRDPGLVDVPTGSTSPWFAWMEANPTKTYLIGSAQTAGSSTGNGAGNSYDFGLRPSRSVFNVLFGSYLGDWEFQDNFMRASLAGNASGDSLGLTCFWGGRPNLYMQSMGLGETIGYSARVSQNSDNLFYASQFGAQGVHTALMGDPALRLYSVQPPQNLQAASSNGSVTLSWAASSESNLLGYLVYRGTSATGPFVKLTASPIAPTTYTDSTVSNGTSYTYLVKTLKLETTPSGTFQNSSSASVATLTASSGGTSILPAPSGLQVSATNSITINLSWMDNATGETAYRVERRSTPSGSFSTLAALSANTTAYTDVGPLTAGATFYYRVLAVGSAGDSLPSAEVALSGYTGSIKFESDVLHLSRAAGYVDVPVRRIGGSTGAVTVICATEAGSTDSALPGVDYTATSSTLTFADGETLKTARVTLLKSSPQPLHKLTVRLSSPTGGAQLITHRLTYAGSFATVLVEDPAAPVTAPWKTTVIGGSYEPGAAGQVGNNPTSIFWGGTWNNNATEDGRFTYQTVTGDTVMTMKINAPTHGTAALMVRTTAANNYCRMVAVRFSNGATPSAQFWARNSEAWPWDIVTLPTTAATIQVPYWARITRSGAQFTGEISPDGVTWTVLGSANVSGLPNTAEWGFFQGVGLYDGPQRAELTNISVATVPVPTAPQSLAAIRNSSGGVLTWVNTASNASGLRIERRLLPSGTFAEIATALSTATTYTDTGASPTQSYEYRVRAYNNSGTSDYTNTATLAALAPPSTPASFTFSFLSDATVSFSWTDNSPVTQGFYIERRAEGASNFVQIGTTSGLSFIDGNITLDTGYEYRIRAYNGAGNSAYTSTVALATLNQITRVITTATGNGADAQISNGANATVNYGNATTMALYRDKARTVKTDAYLRFDLTSLPTGSGWTVVDSNLAATNAVNLTTNYIESIVYLLGNSTSSWTEPTLTWNNAPYNSSATSLPTDAVLAGYLYSSTVQSITAGAPMVYDPDVFDLSTALTTKIGAGATFVDFYLEFTNTSPVLARTASVASRENTAYSRPTLTLTLASLAPIRATNLTGSVPSIGTVTLNWTDTSSNETGFRVEVSTNDGASYSTVATLAANTTTLTTSAIPNLVGYHLFRVVALNALGSATPSLPVQLAPIAPPPLAVTTVSLPAATQGVAYSQSMAATGGTGTRSWSFVSGALPAGLTLGSGGVLSGTPTAMGTRNFTVRVTDSAGGSDTQAFSLVINPPVPSTIAYEGFNYGVGVDLSTQTPPAPFAGTYQGGRMPGYTTVSGSLSYTNGGTLVTSGNAMTGGNSYQTTGLGVNFSDSVWSPYKTTANNQFGNPSNVIGNGTMYVSFLLQCTSGTSTIGFYTGDNNASPNGQLAVGTIVEVASNGTVALRLKSYDPAIISFNQVSQNSTSGNGTTLQSASASPVTAGTINLYVLKIEFGATDKVTLFVNPTVGGSEPGSASASLTAPAGENLIFGSIAQYLNSAAGSAKFDELRFGATWAGAVPAVSAPLTGIAAWFDSYGLPSDGTGLGSPTAILSGDGITNLMKYALGIDPDMPGYQGNLWTGTVNVSGSDYLGLTYTRPEPAPSGVSYVAEASTDLVNWSTAGLVETLSTPSGGLRSVSVRHGTPIGSEPRQFLRLKITAP